MRTLRRMPHKATHLNASNVKKPWLLLQGRTNCRLIVVAVWLATICACTSSHVVGSSVVASDSAARLARAFRDHESGFHIEGEGKIIRLLSDDLDGSRHQRFILELETGQTLLIAHNIDLAPRIEAIKVGDDIGFFGVYEWNQKGGTIHWTHRDPNRRHVTGWLKHKGRVYQ
jgi:hypothetical protein